MADVPGLEAGRRRLQEGAERRGVSPRRLAEELEGPPKSDNARRDEGGYQIPRSYGPVRAPHG